LKPPVDDRLIRMPAHVTVMSGDTDVRIVFDRRLSQRPRKRLNQRYAPN
jgi:hypothetical protein